MTDIIQPAIDPVASSESLPNDELLSSNTVTTASTFTSSSTFNELPSLSALSLTEASLCNEASTLPSNTPSSPNSLPSNSPTIIIWTAVLHSLPYINNEVTLRPSLSVKSQENRTSTTTTIDNEHILETVYDSLYQYPSSHALPTYPLVDSNKINDISLLNTSIIFSINTVFSGNIEIIVYHHRSVSDTLNSILRSNSMRKLLTRISSFGSTSPLSNTEESPTYLPEEIFRFNFDSKLLLDYAATHKTNTESYIYTIPLTLLECKSDGWKFLEQFSIDLMYGIRNEKMFQAGIERQQNQELLKQQSIQDNNTNNNDNIYVNEKRIQQSKDPNFILEQEVLASMLLDNKIGYSV